MFEISLRYRPAGVTPEAGGTRTRAVMEVTISEEGLERTERFMDEAAEEVFNRVYSSIHDGRQQMMVIDRQPTSPPASV